MLDVRFILVRPRNPVNIGAAARALANFGFADLSVVEPYEPVWKEARSALAGSEVLSRSRRQSLEEALGDRQLVLGTTSGRRRELRQPLFPLPRLGELIAERLPAGGGRLALLFGSEKTGLRNRDLQYCHALLRIPTQPSAASMNLGQAVAVTAYELRRSTPGELPRDAGLPPPSQEQLESLLGKTLEAFRRLKYMDSLPEGVRAEKLRRMFLRWKMARPDAAVLQAVFKRVIEKLEKRDGCMRKSA